MRILTIRGSPHRNGSSNMLADRFAEGAREAGHEVESFDAAHEKIVPCIACGRCGMDGPCVLKDRMEDLKDMIRGADMVVFVTPLYYFGMSAQLKAVVDRLYSFNGELTSMGKDCAMIVAQNNPDASICDALVDEYHRFTGYLAMNDRGVLVASGCGTPEATSQSPFMEKAYGFGRSI